MRKRELNEVIQSIGYGLKDEYRIHPERPAPTTLPAGPNEWDLVTQDDYGSSFDYEVLDHDTHVVYFPVCKAAREWGNRHLPEWLDRWGTHGWKIPKKAWPAVQTSLQRDKLISEDEYVEAMNADQELARQWQ